MFEASFLGESWDQKSLVLVGTAHCSSWNKQKLLTEEMLSNTTFVVMNDRSNEEFCKDEMLDDSHKEMYNEGMKNCELVWKKSTDECHEIVFEALYGICVDYGNTDFYPNIKCIWDNLSDEQCMSQILATFND